MAIMDKAAIGQQYRDAVYEKTIAICETEGVTSLSIVKGIKAGLRAKEVKAQYDKDAGSWAYSKALISWGARQKAIDQAIGILGVKAPEKHDLTTGGKAIDFNSIPADEREMLLESQRIMMEKLNEKRRKRRNT